MYGITGPIAATHSPMLVGRRNAPATNDIDQVRGYSWTERSGVRVRLLSSSHDDLPYHDLDAALSLRSA